MISRDVQPEQLDSLPHDHDVARRIHEDIHRFNRLMGNFRWIGNALNRSLRPGDRVLEIAAGRGQLIRSLHREGALDKASRIAAFDAACPRPSGCPDEIEWFTCRAEDFRDYGDFNIIITCHFLHQLEDHALASLAHNCRRADLWIAAEPRRHPFPSLLCRASALVGMSQDGIADGLTSIRAGFRRKELPRLLGLDDDAWRLDTSETLLGRYGLLAERKSRKR
jgi:2-polyprenyl-3-methyl-5-hydroxy-6-metoxy-1,4-benzoquinol methylase